MTDDVEKTELRGALRRERVRAEARRARIADLGAALAENHETLRQARALADDALAARARAEDERDRARAEAVVAANEATRSLIESAEAAVEVQGLREQLAGHEARLAVQRELAAFLTAQIAARDAVIAQLDPKARS